MKKRQYDHEPGEQQHEDLDEVREEATRNPSGRRRLQDRSPASIPTCASRPGRRNSADEKLVPEAFRPKPAKPLEDDAGKTVPVANQEREHADKQRLLDEPSENVLVGAP